MSFLFKLDNIISKQVWEITQATFQGNHLTKKDMLVYTL